MTERRYIEDVLKDCIRRVKERLEGSLHDDDREFDEFLERMIAEKKGVSNENARSTV